MANRLRFDCSNCGKSLKVEFKPNKTKVRCPSCRTIASLQEVSRANGARVSAGRSARPDKLFAVRFVAVFSGLLALLLLFWWVSYFVFILSALLLGAGLVLRHWGKRGVWHKSVATDSKDAMTDEAAESITVVSNPFPGKQSAPKLDDHAGVACSQQVDEERSALIRNSIFRLPTFFAPTSRALERKPQFHGAGSTLQLDRCTLTNPMVYAYDGVLNHSFDSSLIELGLSVSPPGTAPDRELPYWPNYRDCSAAQRSFYLDWLVGQRQNSNVPIGYAFLFFYGLERRILIDRADHQTIALEVIGMLNQFSDNRSFCQYASAFLWTILATWDDIVPLDQRMMEDAIAATKDWSEASRNLCLVTFAKQQRPLTAALAYSIAEEDPRSQQSMIVRRHVERFRKLFHARYLQGEPLVPRESKRTKRLTYMPASSTLVRCQTEILNQFGPVPNVLALSSQFKPLTNCWNQCIEDLREFDRAAKVAPQSLTAEAYEALPDELKNGDHPESQQWIDAIEKHTQEGELTILPFSVLAWIKQIEERPTLTKSQCESILATADALGFGIEPDARHTGKNYKWDESVGLFRVDADENSDWATYNAAATMLRLGLTVAQSDTAVDARELEFITSQIDRTFQLTAGQRKRLEHLRALLFKSEMPFGAVSSTLKKHLTKEQRRKIGAFLVSLAAVDTFICPAEKRALRKIYKALGLEENDLDSLAMPTTDLVVVQERTPSTRKGEPILRNPEVEEEGFALNMDLVDKLLRESQEIRQTLHDAMLQEDEAESQIDIAKVETGRAIAEQTKAGVEIPAQEKVVPAPDVSASQSPVAKEAGKVAGWLPPGLDAKYATLLLALLGKQEWPILEAKSLARENGIMLAGGIEAINEWSQQHFGDWILEEGDVVLVHAHLMESLQR